MDISYLVRGLIFGFSIAAPVGPIGLLCIRRTLAEGRNYGLVSGLGAATADAFYGFIAAFGLTAVSGFLVSYSFWTRLLGGIFLCYLGFKIFTSEPAKEAKAVSNRKGGLWGAYASTLFLTLTNPTTILSFVAIFAGMGVASSSSDYLSATVLVIGVFVGSAIWWGILSGGVNLFRTRFNAYWMRWVNRLSGVLILSFGLVNLVSLFF